MARRLDRRVQRTRKLLRESLMALILEEGYDPISIQDITDKANLGRATFYLHFKDKDELLLDVMDQLMADFLDQVPQVSEAQWRLEDSKAIAKLFDFAADHYDLYRILIFGSGGITASRQLHQTVAENIKICIEKDIRERGADPALPSEFIANHFAGSLLSTIYWWLDNDLPYSVEEMAIMFQKINKMDRETLMGQNESTLSQETKEDQKGRKKRGKEKPKPKNEKTQSKSDAQETDENEKDSTGVTEEEQE